MLSAYAKSLYLFGEDRDLIAYAVRRIGIEKSYDLPITLCGTADEALQTALSKAGDGDELIFTPIDGGQDRIFDPEQCRPVRKENP